MPGSVPSMAVQKKLRVIPPSQGPLSTRTIEGQRKNNAAKITEGENNNIKPNTKENNMNSPSMINKTIQGSNTTSPRTTAGQNGLNTDERLRLAKERREEQEKILASRELGWLEREQRARRYYEQQLVARKRRLLEQRLREERRRAAVEEKRNRRLKEEKERHESAVRRTMERSQKAQQGLSQNTRGRRLTKNNVPRRLSLTTWEKNLVNRLLTPTCSYLARSKSAVCQSGEEVSCHTTTTTTTVNTHKPQHPPAPAHHKTSTSPSPSSIRSINLAQTSGRIQNVDKSSISGSNPRSATVNTRAKPATNTQNRTASPSPERTLKRPVICRHSTPLQLELPAVPEEDLLAVSSALFPENSRTSAGGQQEENEEENRSATPPSDSADAQMASTARTEGDGSSFQMPPYTVPPPAAATNRPPAGTTDPGEASRLLAEKRRQARLQREREEQERLQREESDRRSCEELERRRAEERARLQAEVQRLVEEKRRRDEEEQRRAEEERAQAMREAALLQKQREDEKAEQIKRERESLAQKEEAERQARKKRLEEIMRRTRRPDPADMTPVPMILPGEGQPKENTEPVQNGTLGEAMKLSAGAKPSHLGINGVEDMVPVVAFKERRSLRTLAGLEDIQTHQRAEVI